ncbi:MAG: hypothetical protein OXH00_05290 [Candidatus Poribacteria bacterium]|nr:hypothetical protein [Candidatus Poribacteria bacterium]
MAKDKVQEEVTNEDIKELILEHEKNRKEDVRMLWGEFEKVHTKLRHLQNGQTKTNKQSKKLKAGQESMLERLDNLEVGQDAIVHCLTEVDSRVNELRKEGFGEKPNSPIDNLYHSKVKESQTSEKKQSKRNRKKAHSTQ